MTVRPSVSVAVLYKYAWSSRASSLFFFLDLHEREALCQFCSALLKFIASRVSFPFLGST